MEIINQIEITNDIIHNDIIVKWQGRSNHMVKVSVKYRLLGKSEWAKFMKTPEDSMNQMVSFHRELKGERGIYSFLFICRNIANRSEEIASYKKDNIMLGKVINVFYHRYTKGNLDYLEFTDIEDDWVVPANYLYIDMEHRKYPIGFDIQKGSRVAIPKSAGLKLKCIAPYEQMYQLVQL